MRNSFTWISSSHGVESLGLINQEIPFAALSAASRLLTRTEARTKVFWDELANLATLAHVWTYLHNQPSFPRNVSHYDCGEAF